MMHQHQRQRQRLRLGWVARAMVKSRRLGRLSRLSRLSRLEMSMMKCSMDQELRLLSSA